MGLPRRKDAIRSRVWGVAALTGLALSACAQQPTRTSSYRGHEYFSQAKYGAASPKMVAEGQPVPRGGGQYLVGHPYTIAGHRYYPGENQSYSAVGMASWYGNAFHGRRTANGEVYDMRALSAAHPTMPLPSYARVTNLSNGYSVIVRVNDRGPYHGGRVMDVSSRVADVLDFKGAGTAKVKVEYVARAPMEGSDDRQLLASLRTDGSAATIDGIPSSAPVMVAAQDPPPLIRLFSPAAHAPAPRPTHGSDVADAEPSRVPIANPPVPPSRPFDLGAIPNAGEPIASETPTPPIRVARNDRALYFAPPRSRAGDAFARANDPFARLLKRADAHPPADEDP
jgi:rare lipoprotein A